MAGKSAAQLEKELAAARAELAETQAALTAAKETKIVSPPVPGKFVVECPSPEGELVKKTFKFKNGRISTPIKFGDDIGHTVPSAMLIALANGAKREKIKGIEDITAMANMDQDGAQLELEYLVEINASTIEEVK